MLVDIAGVHLWNAATWNELIDDTISTWNTLPDGTWDADYAAYPLGVWNDWLGDASWDDDYALYPTGSWDDWFKLRDQLVLDGQATLHQRIEERSTAELEVYDETAEYLFQQGQEVLVFDPADMSILFGGLIVSNKVEVVTRNDTGVPVLTHSIQCSDYHLIAEKRVFNKAYVAPSSLTIAYDILAVLAEDGITEGFDDGISSIQDGGVLPDQLFSFVMCSDALDTLAKLCGFTWWIDQNKQLYFVDYTTYPAAWPILDGSEILFSEGLDWTPSGADYRNVQWVNGGKALTPIRTEAIKGDGVSKSFPLGFPLAKEPIITINGSVKNVGIKGVESGQDWYWNEGDNTIYQDDGGTPLAGDTATVQYYGQYPLVTQVKRAAEITRNKLLMGFGSGKVENIYVDASILDVDSAIAMAEGLLGNYAQEGALLHYKTYNPGLAAGTLQTVTLDYFGLDEVDLLILAVDTEFIDGHILYTVEAALGPVDPSWTKIFCKIASNLKAQAIQNVSLDTSAWQGVESFSKNWLSSYHPNPFISVVEGVTPSSIDFPCFAEEDRFSYLVLYKKVGGVDTEFMRKVIANQTENDAETEIDTIGIIFAVEANDVDITAIGFWSGVEASMTPGSGIETDKFAYSHTKTHLESIQFDVSDVKGI
jgi:hypothetical protein